jgi:hypothetical protein
MIGFSLRGACSRFGLVGVGLVGLLALPGCGDDGGSGDGGSGDTNADGATGATGGATEVGDETTGPLLPDMGLLPPSVCEGMCAARSACGESEVACVNGCDADYANFESEPAPCLSDFEARLVCLGTLSCEDLAAFDDPPGGGAAYPCQPEDEAFTTSCLLGGVVPPATCEAYCAVLSMCTPVTPSECDAVCSMQLQFAEGLSKTCGTATTAMLDCVGTLADCTEYDAYDLQEGDYPCAAEVDVVDVECAM